MIRNAGPPSASPTDHPNPVIPPTAYAECSIAFFLSVAMLDPRQASSAASCTIPQSAIIIDGEGSSGDDDDAQYGCAVTTGYIGPPGVGE